MRVDGIFSERDSSGRRDEIGQARAGEPGGSPAPVRYPLPHRKLSVMRPELPEGSQYPRVHVLEIRHVLFQFTDLSRL